MKNRKMSKNKLRYKLKKSYSGLTSHHVLEQDVPQIFQLGNIFNGAVRIAVAMGSFARRCPVSEFDQSLQLSHFRPKES